MQVKVYLVIEVVKPSCERVIAARLSHKSARSIAKKRGNRTVKLMIANKDEYLSKKEIAKQQQEGEQHGETSRVDTW